MLRFVAGILNFVVAGTSVAGLLGFDSAVIFVAGILGFDLAVLLLSDFGLRFCCRIRRRQFRVSIP